MRFDLRRGVSSRCNERQSQLQAQCKLLPVSVRVPWQGLLQAKGILEILQSLGVCKALHGALTSLTKQRHRLLCFTCVYRMLGDHLWMCDCATLLHGRHDSPVDLSSPAAELALVSGVADKRVLEGVGSVSGSPRRNSSSASTKRSSARSNASCCTPATWARVLKSKSRPMHAAVWANSFTSGMRSRRANRAS
jgi:hypothetical protein